MTTVSTYGLIGIGIASAIGFVFALSILGSDDSLTGQPEESFLLSTPPTEMKGQPEADMPAQGPETSLMMKQIEKARPIVTSITVLKTDGEIIGEAVPQMKLEMNKPVLIQANLINPNEIEVLRHTILLGIKSSEDGSDEQLVKFQGDIAINGNTTLELYWIPDREGSYSIIVFSSTPDELASAELTKPIVEIPIKVG